MKDRSAVVDAPPQETQIALSMKKIRINELARELEVKAHEILDRLPELGVTEKKTHSSSIDEDVALQLRRLLGHPDDGRPLLASRDEEVEAEEPLMEAAVEPAPQAGPAEPEPVA